MFPSHRPPSPHPRVAAARSDAGRTRHFALPAGLFRRADMRLHDAALPAGDSPWRLRQNSEPRFELGQLCITPAAAAVLPQHEVLAAIARHSRGDWGALTPEDHRANDRALREGGQLLSVYHTVEGVKFYLITDWDRTFTTVLLPEDY